jgi:crotonobetainyl-CoA:carnitine CoA-transferase CaiB-like acyl-CoA transferase
MPISHRKRWAAMSKPSIQRSLDVGAAHFVVVGANRSALHAARWLSRLGCTIGGAASLEVARAMKPAPLAFLVAGDVVGNNPRADAPTATEIFLWDFEVGRPGNGDFASAVSGVSMVIGAPDGPPGTLPAKMPEKWAGIFGACLALGLKLANDARKAEQPRRIDVSAADILRAFAEQNSGNHAGVPYGWRRNGRTAIEHGGVFPQGFFPCRDGFVAVQARSRPDWRAVLQGLGDPEWSRDAGLQDPFRLSEDDSRVLPLLIGELMKHTREELLQRAIDTGAPMAPVLSTKEAHERGVFRPAFESADGSLQIPLTVARPRSLAS